MWKKPEPEADTYSSPSPSPSPGPASPSGPDRSAPRSGPGGDRAATIGPSISIKGDVTGEEDLVIQGRIEGKVDLKQHNVTVGENGRIKADVFGRRLIVEGAVEGNLYGDESIVVRSSGKVRGNIAAPRVSLEDGARFKGSIDMDERRSGERKSPGGSATSTSGGGSDTPAKPGSESSGGSGKPGSGKPGSGGSSGSGDRASERAAVGARS